MRELVIQLTGYLKTEYPLADDKQKQAFRRLLSLPHPELIAYLLDGEMPRTAHLPVSSTRFETILVPDTTLRRCVLLCGCLTAFAGFPVILMMPLSWIMRTLLALLWLLESIRELRRLKQGAARIRALRLDAGGSINGIGQDGNVETLTLMSGSIVLRKLAWLRVRFPDGLKHGELFLGDPAGDLEWQRLQLIWRHRRGAFGRQDGS